MIFAFELCACSRNEEKSDEFRGMRTEPRTLPPLAVLGLQSKPGGTLKDTSAHIRDQGVFVINLVDEALGAQMNQCAVDFPPDVSEIDAAKLNLLPSEKVKVYDKGVTITNGLGDGLEGAHDLLVSYRAGDVLAPQLGVSEALASVAQHFTECVREGRRPLTDGAAGLRVIRVLEAAERSLADGGMAVELR